MIDPTEAVAAAWANILGDAGGTIIGHLPDAPGHERAQHAQRLLDQIAASTGLRLPLTVIYQAPTLPELTRLVQDGERPAAPPFVLLKPGEGGLPLFTFPGIGGIGLDVCELARRVPHPRPTFLCFPRGLDQSAPPLRRVPDMAAYHLANIRTLQPHGPYRLLGYSGGGVVALETARQARAAGETTAFLGMIDTPLPERFWPRAVRLAFLRDRTLHHLAAMRGRGFRAAAIHLAGRFTPLFWRVRRLFGVTTDTWSPYRMDDLPPGMKEVWDAELEGDATLELLPSDQKAIFFVSETADTQYGDPNRIWPRYLPNIAFHRVAGSHSSILFRPGVEALAAQIGALLA